MLPVRKAAFLDRDGTIIEEKHYIADPAHVVLAPRAIEGLQSLRDQGYLLVIITNQSGIARGLYSEADFHAVQDRVTQVLLDHGVALDGVFFCPHHPDYTGACDCRKPGPGMYREAAEKLGIDLAHSVYIGDRIKDVLPARHFGGTGILVGTGYGLQEAGDAPDWVQRAETLTDAAEALKKSRPA